MTVIKGCMFAGKTKELLELYRKDEGKKSLYKPRLDNRSGTQYVSTHDGVFERATPITTVKAVERILGTIYIDEIQFFPKSETINEIKNITLNGGKVVVAGLARDYTGANFGATEDLYNMADVKCEVLATCAICGKHATESCRVSNDKEQIVVGGDDKYMPVCKNCFVNI